MKIPINFWAIYYKSFTWFKAILGGDSLTKLPFGVTSAEVVINCPDQSTVNWWFGARWFGILGVPLSNNALYKGIPNIKTTNPNHQLTISWTHIFWKKSHSASMSDNISIKHINLNTYLEYFEQTNAQAWLWHQWLCGSWQTSDLFQRKLRRLLQSLLL